MMSIFLLIIFILLIIHIPIILQHLNVYIECLFNEVDNELEAIFKRTALHKLSKMITVLILDDDIIEELYTYIRFYMGELLTCGWK